MQEGNTTTPIDARVGDDDARYEVGDLVTLADEGHVWRRRIVARKEQPITGLFLYQTTGPRTNCWRYEDELRLTEAAVAS